MEGRVMGLNRRPGSFHITGNGVFDPNDQSTPDAGLPFAITDPLLWQPGLPESNPAGPSTPAPMHGGASAEAATGQGGTANIHDVVFIDSSVPDIQALLNGLKPGEKAFVIDANSDGLSQIATILQSQHLSNLSGIEIVVHGASGQLDLGSTVLNDADLAGHAAALSTIGAALAPGGDLALYACDTAAGATGQQFISDLSHYAGGVDVAAATHLVGSADGGGSWTLDASTAAPVTAAAVPFTPMALASYHGELASGPDAQIWFGTLNYNNTGDANPFGYVNSDVNGGNPTYVSSTSGSATSATMSNIGLDTVAGLVFGIENNENPATTSPADAVYLDVGSMSTGAIATSLNLNPDGATSEYTVNALAVDPENHVVYVGIWGDGTADTGIIKLSYNPTTGVINDGNSIFTGSGANEVINPSLYVVSNATGSSFTNPQAMWLDVATQKLYVAANDLFGTDGAPFGGYPATNGIYVVDLTSGSPVATLLSSQTQFPTSDPDNAISALAVNTAQGIIYFTTTESTRDNAAGVQSTLWEMPIAGGTAIELTLPSAITNFTVPPGGLAFDPTSQQLVVSDKIAGEVDTLTLAANGLSLTGVSAVLTPAESGNAVASTTGLDLDILPTIGTLSGTASLVHQGGSGVTLLSATPAGIADSDSGGFLASATVTISNPQAGDELGLGSTFTYNGTPSGASVDGGSFLVSFSNDTLTIANATGVENTFAQYEAILAEVSYQATGTNSQTSRTITWQVNDGADGSPAGTTNVTTTLVHVDVASTANPNTNTAVEGGTAATGNVLTNSTNPGGDTLTVSGFTDGSAGTLGTVFHGTYGDLTLNSDGSYTYTAGATTTEQNALATAATGSPPTEIITYTESDGLGDTSSSTLTITIDRPPTATPDTNSAIAGGSAATGNVLTNDVDKDGHTITVTGFTDGSAGTLGTVFHGTYGDFTLNASGNYTYTAGATLAEQTAIANAAAGSPPTEIITYTESDNHGGTASTTLSIAVDRAPVLTVSAGPVTYSALSTPIALQSAVSITDPDGGNAIGSATVTVTGGYAGDGDLLSVGGGTGTIVTGDGSYNVVYSGAGTSETLTITTASGPGTLTDYQQLLDEIDFSSTATDPTNAGANAHRSATFTVTDANGAASAAAGPETIGVELAPSISSVTAITTGNVTDLDAGKTVTVTVDFTSNVNVTGLPELQLNDNEVATYAGGTGTTALTFSYTVQPGDNTPDLQVQSLLLNGGTIEDSNGHAAVLTNANNADLHLQVDTTPPSVSSINLASSSPNHASSEAFTVTFSESVTGVVASDFTAVLGGTVADSGGISVSGSGNTYTVTVSGVTGDGTLGLDLNSSGTGIADLAGNAISGGFTAGQVYTIEHTPPSVSSINLASSSPNNASSEAFTVTFSESVTGVVASDFTAVTGGTVTDGGGISVSGSGASYTVTVGGVTGDGTLGLDLNSSGTGIADLAGNAIAGGFTAGQVYTIEHTPPAAGTLSFVTDNGASDLNAGHTVTFTLMTSENVFVTGTPELQLSDGEFATYTGGSGATDALTFSYTVKPGDTSADLQVAGANPNGGLALNGGTILDGAGNALTGTVATDTHLIIDTTPPTETSLTATTDNSQTDIGIGHTVTITLDASEAVSVAGTPTLLLNNGETATYTGSTSSDALTFTYKVVAGDTASDLQVTGYSGTIQDAAGNSLAPVSGDLALKIDGTVPPTPTLALTHDTGISSTDHITTDPTITYSAPTPGDTLLYKVDGGSFSTTVPNFEADPNFATDHSADGVHTVSVEQRDALGNISAAASLTFTLDTTPPILTGITASPASGSIFAGSTDTFTFAFDEAVDVTGGTPTLTLNDGGTAVYDAAATAALHDPTKLAFDYLVSSSDTPTQSLAITGYVANGATVADLAGNLANLSSIAETFGALSVNESHTVPALTFNGFTRPALDFDFAGNIILGPAALAAESAFGIKFLYAGLPESTPYPPVAENPLTDFHLIA
jgi:VCBS repeat-containing protein